MRPAKIPVNAATMFPTLEQACTAPSAYGRARAGVSSATKATPTANWPPTPRPHRNRYMLKSQTPLAKTLSPVKTVKNRMVIDMVLARPMRSPNTPKITPPNAQPIMKMDVA